MPASTVFRLLGTELVRNRSNEKVSTASLCGKDRVLGIYFSAQWCPPCRSFTPELGEFYRKLKSGAKAEQLEIVFVSSDNDEAQFEEFYREMPWTALPYGDRERSIYLSRKFHIQSIPTLILLDSETGQVITSHGRDWVADDPEAKEFPWRPRTLKEALLDCTLVNNQSERFDISNFRNHIKGIYFSANWCPPCKAFTPQLVNVYNKLKEAGHRFEVIFISSDRCQESFDNYSSTMPWFIVPYAQENQRKELTRLMGVQGIPTLIILDEDNNVITKDGRFEVNEDLNGEKFPWKPQLVNELTEKFAGKLNENPCLILFAEGDEKEMENCRNLLLPVAEENLQNKLGDCEDLNLTFFVGAEAEICDSLREYAQLEDSVPLLTIIDIANSQQFILEDDVEITVDVIRTFVQKYYNRQLSSRPLRE